MEEALVIASAFHKDHKTRIIVKKNRYMAQQLYNRLSPLLPNVLLFVMEESLRVQAIASSPEDKEELIYSLTQIIKNDEPKIIICNTAAYVRYLPDVNMFKDNCFTLHINQEFDMADLKSKLNRIGYSKLNYVDRPCTYASRGGIVDIFSLEYENPIRIEFFDTEIESIRFFDENTQRTIKEIDSIMISPATDLLFTDEQICTIKEKVNSKLEKESKKLFDEEKELLVDHIEKDMMALESYDTSSHLYWYFSYVNTCCLNDYINAEVILSSKEEIERFNKQLNEDNIA
ncbi:MAG: transcription-repair coupling factor, partial [Holdemanella sp.]|nr:transcription-repair coupling factor [Holdemanella sp.]